MRVTRAAESGQSLTEFGLVAIILITMFLGIAQIGQLMFAQITLDTAVREGARLASERPNDSGVSSGGNYVAGGVTCPVSGNIVCNQVNRSAGNLFISSSALTIQFKAVDTAATWKSTGCAQKATEPSDGYVEVIATYNAPIFIPLLGNMLANNGNARTMTATATNRIEDCGITTSEDLS